MVGQAQVDRVNVVPPSPGMMDPTRTAGCRLLLRENPGVSDEIALYSRLRSAGSNNLRSISRDDVFDYSIS